MDKNYRYFITRVAIFFVLIFLVRFAFQMPINLFTLEMFRESATNRLFSKIDAVKVMGVVGALFAIYYRNRISNIDRPRKHIIDVKYLILSVIAVTLYYGLRYLTNLYELETGLFFILMLLGKFVLLTIAFISMAIAVFSYDYLKSFLRRFKKPLLHAVVLIIALYFLLISFQNLWPVFSIFIATALIFGLGLFFPVIHIMDGNTPILIVEDFAVSIGPPCSGIDSMLFFIVFFAGIFALDRKLLKQKQFIILGIIGLLGVVIINIIRLFLLILVGIFISKTLAVGLFHTNAAWVLFVLYFFLYYWIIRRFIYKKEDNDV